MRHILILTILIALGASCIHDAGDGPGGGGQTCTPQPVEVPAVGAVFEVAPPTLFDAEGTASSVRVAWSGSVAVVVWTDGPTLFATRLAPDGSPLDVPPQIISTDLSGNISSVVWNGTHFVALWRDTSGVVRRGGIGTDGVPIEGTDASIVGAGDLRGMATASDGGTTLVVWWTATYELLGARLGADGAQLDPTPITIASDAGPAVVQWDGSAFVTVYNGSTGLRAARVSASGALLDPDGVSIAAAAASGMSLVGEIGGSVVAWIEATDSASTLYAARLSPALGVVAGPVAVESLDSPYYETSLAAPAISRSEDGSLVIAWAEASDTDAHATYARALADDLSPLGPAISRPRYGSGAQALVGVGGASHLDVRAGEPATAESLERTAQGLNAAGEQAFAMIASAQSPASVAGSPSGYLTAWYEFPASGRRLLGRFLGLDGTPLGDGPVELAPSDPATSNTGQAPPIAWSGTRYLIAGGAGSSSQLFSIAPGALSAETRALPLLGLSAAIGCGDGTGCLLAWNAQQSILALRLSPQGEVLDADPLLLAEQQESTVPLTVLRLGESLGVFWPRGGVGVDADGHHEPLSGFSSCPGDPGAGGFDGAGGFGGATCAAAFGDGVPIAAGPDTLLAIFRQNGMWAQLLHFDGSDAGRLDVDVGWNGPATWDGSAYLLAQGNSCYVVGADASLLGPAEGLSLGVSLAGVGLLASAWPGYSLGVGRLRSPTYGVFRLVAQSIVRPDADACPPP